MNIRTKSNFEFVKAYVSLINLTVPEEKKLNDIQTEIMAIALSSDENIFKKKLPKLQQMFNLTKHAIWYNRREMIRKGWLVDGDLHMGLASSRSIIKKYLESDAQEKELELKVKIILK